MKIIRDSAEHHFLTMLDKLKEKPKDWVALHFALSKTTSHDDLIQDIKNIQQKIEENRALATVFLEDFATQVDDIETGFLYLFLDGDIVFLARAGEEQEQAKIGQIYREMAEKIDPQLADTGSLMAEFYNYQKLADQKLLSAKRFEAYETMTDENKVSSIGVRRDRREHPMVLLVEDDRFTASYASSILNKDYDLVISRNGEESIGAYIETAPDIMFLDIHLPGLNGHGTLQAIKAIDPNAFVVMLSVDTFKGSIKKASDIGAKSFLKKPFSKERLINTVKTSPFIQDSMINGGSIH